MRQIEVDKEFVITVREAYEKLGVNGKTHWIRVVTELTDNYPPWVAFRVQAIKRGAEEAPCPNTDS